MAKAPEKKEDPQAEFERLYSDLNAARAAFFAPDGNGNIEDAVCERYFRAERIFMATPTPRPCLIWQKWEVLEIAATREITDGKHVDNRIVTMIASIKADHLRFKMEICP